MKNYDFIDALNNCNFCYESSNNNNSDLSSDEEDDYYFENMLPLIRESEMKNLINYIDPPLTKEKPILKIFENKMNEKIVPLLNPKSFFIDHGEKKFPFLMSLPNSYLPIIKKSLDSSDPVCCPSYMTQQEENDYTRPFFMNMEVHDASRGGIGLKYDLEKRRDDQSSYVYYQRKFYEEIMIDRLVNGKEKNPEKKNGKEE